ncbi:hypothetical protein GCM10022280_18160 [Sphingomonas swuensis]|uniref:Uncharacterized protein n=1 Tax=Sphingomonas swuensis TaxID=977800 RepID=A0ABP7SZM3_9SPHN
MLLTPESFDSALPDRFAPSLNETASRFTLTTTGLFPLLAAAAHPQEVLDTVGLMGISARRRLQVKAPEGLDLLANGTSCE